MKTTIIVILLAFCKISMGQFSTDENTCDSNFVNFIGKDSIEFKVTVGEGLTSQVYGYGAIKTHRNRIILHTIRPNSKGHSNFLIIDTIQPDRIELQVFVESEPLIGGNVVIFRKERKKFITGTILNEKGCATFNNLNTYNFDDLFMLISFVGYDSYSIPLRSINGKSVIINLSPYLVLDDIDVIFKRKKENGKDIMKGPIFKTLEHNNWR
jgi:hypothetical protein